MFTHIYLSSFNVDEEPIVNLQFLPHMVNSSEFSALGETTHAGKKIVNLMGLNGSRAEFDTLVKRVMYLRDIIIKKDSSLDREEFEELFGKVGEGYDFTFGFHDKCVGQSIVSEFVIDKNLIVQPTPTKDPDCNRVSNPLREIEYLSSIQDMGDRVISGLCFINFMGDVSKEDLDFSSMLRLFIQFYKDILPETSAHAQIVTFLDFKLLSEFKS